MANSSRVYQFDSAFDPNHTDSSFTVAMAPRDKPLAFLMENMYIPFSFYAVNTYTHSFTLTDDSAVENTDVDYTVTIADGNYTASEYVTAVLAAMNASGTSWTYTMTYDTKTGKFTFGGATRDFSITVNSQGNHKLLGFAASSTNTSSSQVLVSSYPADMTGPSYIDVKLDNISTNVYNNQAINDPHFLDRVPVSNSAFGVVSLSKQIPMPVDISSRFANQLQFSYWTNFGTPLLMNGHNVYGSLHVEMDVDPE